MRGHQRTFLGLFDGPSTSAITGIEIPIIQRDYAQGRADGETRAIRDRFAQAIVAAANGAPGGSAEGLGLDFVYGGVHERTREGRTERLLQPLDGQQRLTTLYLLHWYVASRAGVLNTEEPWLSFSYATRPSARDFTSALRRHPLPDVAKEPSTWIKNQAWYLYPWNDDPTIKSMLVMLDTLHGEIVTAGADPAAIWQRLSSRADPAIWFLFLPLDELDRGEDLYIKMNSRGKALTPFEVFKADLEDALTASLSPEAHRQLTLNLDKAWTDVLWHYQTSETDPVPVDVAFIRYFSYLIEVCEWSDDEPGRRWSDREKERERTLEERARLAFAAPHANSNRDLLFHAFGTWVGTRPGKELGRTFQVGDQGEGPLPLLVSSTPDLFGLCLRQDVSGLTLPESLLLYAVLIARKEGDTLTAALVDQRLRSVRNLVESAEIQRRRMPEHLRSVERLIRFGELGDKHSLNAAWAADEVIKWEHLAARPELASTIHSIEDHSIVRGRLLAFDLDDLDALPRRAVVFAAVAEPALRDAFGAALLTRGDYSRSLDYGQRRQLGSSAQDESWRELLTTGTRDEVARIRVPLMTLLDEVGVRLDAGATPDEALKAIAHEWLQEQRDAQVLDWRYYLVRYRACRSSSGKGYYDGALYDADLGGYGFDRLRILHGSNYNASFSDVILSAAWEEGDLSKLASAPRWRHQDDPGMRLLGSTVEVLSRSDHLELRVPEGHPDGVAVDNLLLSYPNAVERAVTIVQHEVDGRFVDASDRVQACIRLVEDLAAAGL